MIYNRRVRFNENTRRESGIHDEIPQKNEHNTYCRASPLEGNEIRRVLGSPPRGLSSVGRVITTALWNNIRIYKSSRTGEFGVAEHLYTELRNRARGRISTTLLYRRLSLFVVRRVFLGRKFIHGPRRRSSMRFDWYITLSFYESPFVSSGRATFAPAANNPSRIVGRAYQSENVN